MILFYIIIIIIIIITSRSKCFFYCCIPSLWHVCFFRINDSFSVMSKLKVNDVKNHHHWRKNRDHPRSARILRRVLDLEVACCHSDSSERPSANAGVKNSQLYKNNFKRNQLIFKLITHINVAFEKFWTLYQFI